MAKPENEEGNLCGCFLNLYYDFFTSFYGKRYLPGICLFKRIISRAGLFWIND